MTVTTSQVLGVVGICLFVVAILLFADRRGPHS